MAPDATSRSLSEALFAVQRPSEISAVIPGPNPAISPVPDRGTCPSSNRRSNASKTTALAMFPYSVSVALLNLKVSGRHVQEAGQVVQDPGPPAWTM